MAGSMNYYAYEFAHMALEPMRMAAKGMRVGLSTPLNPLSKTAVGKSVAAACDVFEGLTMRYGKPDFGIAETRIHGLTVPIREEVVWSKPFCNLLHFARDETVCGKRHDPKVLLVAPMSGHYATLLRGTVKSMIAEHDLYITDWTDARNVPLWEGRFDLDDFIDYIIEMVRFLGPNTHVMAVCQPSVPVLAATAVMAAEDCEFQPASLTLMGGPIDTRRNPTVVNNLAEKKPIEWFERTVISRVPFPNPGAMRKVYPGFVQLTGFMTMNLDRHRDAHMQLYDNLIKGDCDSVRQHKEFYEEYLAVMDLPAEFYLQTIATVFQRHDLPMGTLMHRGKKVDCAAIRKTALITIEGEKDDICGLGQTEAAHDICPNIAPDERYHYVQPGVGHYGVFNGTRFRTEIQPRIREMIRTVMFKRRTGAKNMPQPYRKLRDEPDRVICWKEADAATKVKAGVACPMPGMESKPVEAVKPATPAAANDDMEHAAAFSFAKSTAAE